MISDLFDSPWKILIIAVVVLVLFGSKKLPMAAKSLGESMRILKKEVHQMHDDDAETPAGTTAAPAVTSVPQGPAPAPAQIAHQQQVDALQAQLDALRAQTAEAQQSQQVS